MIIATEGWERHSYLNIPVQQQRESWAETENILAKEIHTLLPNLDLQIYPIKNWNSPSCKKQQTHQRTTHYCKTQRLAFYWNDKNKCN